MIPVWQERCCRRHLGYGSRGGKSIHPGLARGVQSNHMSPQRKRGDIFLAAVRERDVTMEWDQTDATWEEFYSALLVLKHRRKGPQAKEGRPPLEARRGKDGESPLETPEGMQLCQQVILAQGDCWPIEPWDNKFVLFYLWQCVMAAVRNLHTHSLCPDSEY